jgi:hypothetical protein
MEPEAQRLPVKEISGTSTPLSSTFRVAMPLALVSTAGVSEAPVSCSAIWEASPTARVLAQTTVAATRDARVFMSVAPLPITAMLLARSVEPRWAA